MGWGFVFEFARRFAVKVMLLGHGMATTFETPFVVDFEQWRMLNGEPHRHWLAA